MGVFRIAPRMKFSSQCLSSTLLKPSRLPRRVLRRQLLLTKTPQIPNQLKEVR
uniref:Uncharacterized protein n=1 Tax=Arundo donax TaxID=35708 RepID=A0A0A9H512_ARUDO